MAPACFSRLLPPRPGASALSYHAQPRTAWPGTKHPPDTNKASNPQRLLAMGPMPSPLPNRGWPWARTTLRKTAIALWTVLHTPTRVPPTSRGRGDRLGRGTRLRLLPPRGGSLFLSPFPRVLGRTLRSRNATKEAPPYQQVGIPSAGTRVAARVIPSCPMVSCPFRTCQPHHRPRLPLGA